MTKDDMTARTNTGARRRMGGERGTAVVEFAVLAPLFILLVFGILDFGRALNYWNDSTHLAATGARYAVVDVNPGADDSPATSLAEWIWRNGVTTEMRDNTRVCIDFLGEAQPRTGDPVRVRVETDFSWLPYIGGELGVATTTVRGTAIMRLEQSPTVYSDGESYGGSCS